MTYQNQSGALMESTCNILAEYFQEVPHGHERLVNSFTNYTHGSNEDPAGVPSRNERPLAGRQYLWNYADPKNLYGRTIIVGVRMLTTAGCTPILTPYPTLLTS